MAAVVEETVNDVESGKTVDELKTNDDTAIKSDIHTGSYRILLFLSKFIRNNTANFQYFDRHSLSLKNHVATELFHQTYETYVYTCIKQESFC